MNDLTLIQVTPPIITERLAELKASWMEKAEAAAALECTEETIQTVKKERAEMRKEFDEIEAQRKAALAPIRAKIDAFSAVYKDCVTDSFNKADAEYKRKILDVENDMKQRCEIRLREYFAELCQVHGVDFISYEQSGVKVDMTSAKQKTPRKLMDKLSEFVAGVACNVDAISKMDDAAEIMVEYQKTLNMALAVSTVQERKRRVEEEARRKAEWEAAEQRRKETEAKVEAAAPVMEPPKVVESPKADPVLKCTFTVYATREKLIALKNYLKQEDIRYE